MDEDLFPCSFPCRFQGEAQARRGSLLRRRQRTEQHGERRPTLGGHRQPAQFRIPRALRPGQQGMEGARAQRLLGGPQRIAPPRRAHHGEPVKGHTRGGERWGVRQVRRRQPGHAPAGGGQPGERRQHQLQLTDAFGSGEDFAQRTGRPATAGQFPVKGWETGGDDGRARRGRRAAPEVLPLKEAFEGRHG